MTIKVSVKGRFVYNGKAYGSLEELPEHVREAYANATTGGSGGEAEAAGGGRVKVLFNGTEYESLEAMPPEVRRLYEDALVALRSGHLPAGGGPAQAVRGARQEGPLTAAPIEPGRGASRPLALVFGLALLVLLLGYLLYTFAAAR